MNLKRIGKATALDTSKWKDFLINGGIFVASAAITFTLQNLTTLDFGPYTAIVVPSIGLALKYLQNLLSKLSEPKKEDDVIIPPSPPVVNPNEPKFPVN
jgi:hypothetical protein